MRDTGFRLADWQVDPDSNCIAREGVRRHLEPRAMAVLLALCKQPDAVISTEQLLMACWGSTLYGDNPVHKTIAQLRGALGDNSRAPVYIDTIRKRGYRMVAGILGGQPGLDSAVNPWLARSPFRGLLPFDAEHEAVFFGRDAALFALTHAVSAQAAAGRDLTLLLGPSGSGKTSLVRAGLLPRLARSAGREGGVLLVASSTLDAADSGAHGLGTALACALLDWELDGAGLFPGDSAISLGQRLTRQPAAVLDQVCAAIAGLGGPPGRRRLGLFVDRFEAVFDTVAVSEAERAALLDFLDALARSRCACVILACRNDFYPRVAEYPLLMQGKAGGAHVDLGPPSAAEIAQMIRLPARAARLTFGVDSATQARLDDVLCESAHGNPDVLPLLQYALQELYRLRSDRGELGFDAFQRLGGVEGAIGRRAEELVAALDAPQRAALPRLLARLVVLHENEESVGSRRVPWADLHDAHERALAAALVEQRLCVSELVDGAAGFGLAHDALLRRWPRAHAWIAEHRQALRVRGRIARLALRWVAAGRSADLLLPQGVQLDEAHALRDSQALALSPEQHALIAGSLLRVQGRARQRALAMAAFVGLSLLAGALGLLALGAKQTAQQRRIQADGLMSFMLGDFADKLRPLGRLDLLDSVSAKALDYLAAPAAADAGMVAGTQRARALQVFAEVRIARGQPQAALQALSEARVILLQQRALAPGAREVLLGLGANAFWFGTIYLDQYDWPAAEQHFMQYRAHSLALYALDPAKVEAWIELSYAATNLGTLALKRGDPHTAASQFQVSVDWKTRAARQRPRDRALAAELANSLSWLASARETLGQLAEAMQLYERELQVVEALHLGASDEPLWTSRVARALQHRAGLRISLGQDGAAQLDLDRAGALLRAIIAREPNNRLWQENLAFAELVRLHIMARRGELRATLSGLLALARQARVLTSVDPRKADWSRLAALTDARIAALLFEMGRGAQAAAPMAAALARLEQLHRSNPAAQLTRNNLAAALVATADLARAPGTLAAPPAACTRARALLADSARNSRDHEVLDPWIRAHHCLGEGAAVLPEAARLAQIGYRDAGYVHYLSTHP